VVENCKVVGPVDVAVLKMRPDTPQCYENINFRNITLDCEKGTILTVKPWTQYFDLKGLPAPMSVVRNITLSNFKGRFGALGDIKGNPGQTEISNITLENIDVQLAKGELSATDVKNLVFKNVIVNGKQQR
jgi:hypothetical protein